MELFRGAINFILRRKAPVQSEVDKNLQKRLRTREVENAEAALKEHDFDTLKTILENLKISAKMNKSRDSHWQDIHDVCVEGLAAFDLLDENIINMTKFRADMQACFGKLRAAIANIQ